MSSTIFPEFPYSVDDEPTEEWTVEHFIQWKTLKSMQALDRNCEAKIEALRETLAKGEEELVQLMKRSEDDNDDEDDSLLDTSKENAGALSNTHHIAQAKYGVVLKSAMKSVKKYQHNFDQKMMMKVEVVEGGHEGMVFDIQPRPKEDCVVGRSKGKKFVNKGVSLPKDLEVSTSHGKFMVNDDYTTYYYVDTNSTNGSHYNCPDSDLYEKCEDNIPYPLEHGCHVMVGSTKMKIFLSPMPVSKQEELKIL